MRGNEFLDKMELVDAAYVEAAEAPPKRKTNAWVKWGAVAACFCVMIGAVITLPRFFQKKTAPKPADIVLSGESTAKVYEGYEEGTTAPVKFELVDFSEEEMFSREKMYVFRGRISELSNITISFNGDMETRCIATVVVDKVYRGEVMIGEPIKMLLPCAIGDGAAMIEDTGVISHLTVGMEGIFMPWVYDETSCWEQNGAKLMLCDLAPCGLADGMRWAFLSTGRGLIFERYAYPGAVDAVNLGDIEAYVIEKLG